MAQINASINLMNGMTQPLMNIVNSVNNVISTLRAVNNTNINIDTSSLQASQNLLNQTSADLLRWQQELENQIRENGDEAGRLNNRFREGGGPLEGLIAKAKRLALTLGGITFGKKLLGLSDEITTMNARVNIMAKANENPEDIKRALFESAQRSRADYFATANAAATMGITAKDTFGSSKEVISFMELANKQFTIAGTEGAAKEGAMLQLQQAMSMGVLRGQEFRSVQQGMPTMIDYLAKHLGKTKAQIKEMADQGKLTAGVVKAAMFGAADDINKKFESMPKTLGQIGTSIKNTFIKNFEPVSEKLSKMFNSESFKNFVNTISMGINISILAIGGLISAVAGMVNWIRKYSSYIVPILTIATIGFVQLKWAVIASTAATIKDTIAKGVNAAATLGLTAVCVLYNGAVALATLATGIMTGSTAALTIGVKGLSAAFLACPVVWIALAIMGVVYAIYKLVEWLNKTKGMSLSTFGVIAGAIAYFVTSTFNLLKVFANNIMFTISIIYNNFATFAEFLANLFNDPVTAVKNLFLDLGENIIKILTTVSGVIDKVLGTNLSSGLNDFQDKLNTWRNENVKENKIKIPRMNPEYFQLSDPKEAFKNAHDKTVEIANNIKGSLNLRVTNDLLKTIAGNTGKTNSTLDLTKEELKYLRDVAEQEVINRYTTASINNNNTFNNNINSEMDVDGVVSKFYNGLAEAASTVAEGV
ncbi:tape measure protein [Fusobacterium ulcerans]|uniref:tape measure protein n=1 Tax=Fusobacterium ulcerans TaxID=861 RepID=UPI0027B9E6EE|nr:tape measure protein [Fusobacterium ulcerans]